LRFRYCLLERADLETGSWRHSETDGREVEKRSRQNGSTQDCQISGSPPDKNITFSAYFFFKKQRENWLGKVY